jgi:hypothetical protein
VFQSSREKEREKAAFCKTAKKASVLRKPKAFEAAIPFVHIMDI